ncbi:MAG TPA: hypothetical protein VJP85_01255 [Candidatus Baltobacteraceae bacterium]|nr:hypothetical protein [Candidatus Baltobacteraceae bacterium]
MFHLVFAAAVAAAPSPSPTPLRTIVNESVSPLCTALRQNIGHSIQAVLANDQAIAASKPVFVSMAHDFMSSSIVEQTGLGNLHGSAQVDHDSAAMQLDAQHIERIISTITHNLELIDAQLKDSSRFPKDPKTDADRKALEMRAQLESVETQQKQTLNVLNALYDTRTMEAMAGRGADVLTLFGLNAGNNPEIAGTNQQFSNGPLPATPDQNYDPVLKPSEFNALTNSVFGRFYRIVFLEQGAISSLEQPLAKNVVQTTQRCRGQ